jgi:mono/diheme cytochrome c family protein
MEKRIMHVGFVAAVVGVFALSAAPQAAARADADGLAFFEQDVRPLLIAHCYECHSAEAKKPKGGLLLDSRAGWTKGGASGPAIVPGEPAKSLLIQAVRHEADLQMPPKGKLTAKQIDVLVHWVKQGAPDPRADGAARPAAPTIGLDQGRQFWSFQPLQPTAPPRVENPAWCRTPIDHFILARLEAKGIAPNAATDRRRLIRRASFDLLGLPPTPEEVEAFVRDPAPDAYGRLLDRLLASPHYGERWGRHWLDLARFAESHGYEQDYDRPNAYPYRDFVIKAFNEDLPYDTFVRWQIAGDEYEPDNPLALTATGFLAAGTHATQITANQAEKERYDELDDMVRTIGTTMLGLTLGCARCHDHKYDPIPNADYYHLVAVFATTVRSDYDIPLRDQVPPAKLKALICSEGVKAVRLHTQGRDFYDPVHALKRGDPNQKIEVAQPGFVQVLMRAPEGEKHWQLAPPAGWRTSYRRRGLAGWITDVEQGAGALLARVIVNRLWQHHLGRGLVATPSDFGAQGERPTHPELLDWLAQELVRNGWHLKPIHKLILNSSVYLQDGGMDERRLAADRDNTLFWRQPTRRLEAEAIRDAMLAVSGTLDTRQFGPGTLDLRQARRSIYFFIKRSRLIPMMMLFDAPDSLQDLASRPTTTIAPQALLLLNSPIVRDHATAFACRLLSKAMAGSEEVVEGAYRLALSRPPTADELADAVAFLRQQTEAYRGDGKTDAAELALGDFCQALLSLNEFVYID